MRLFHSPLNNVIYLSIYIKKNYCSLPCPSLTILRLKQKPTLLDLRNDLISFKNVRQFSKLPKMQVRCIIHSLQKKKKKGNASLQHSGFCKSHSCCKKRKMPCNATNQTSLLALSRQLESPTLSCYIRILLNWNIISSLYKLLHQTYPSPKKTTTQWKISVSTVSYRG